MVSHDHRIVGSVMVFIGSESFNVSKTSSHLCSKTTTAKDRLQSSEFNASNIALCHACTPLSRLLQIAKLMNLDDLEDVLDLISSSKRKGNWDLKMEDSKAYLSLRVEFEKSIVEELLGAVEEE